MQAQLKQLESQSHSQQAQILALQRQAASLQESNTALQTHNANLQVPLKHSRLTVVHLWYHKILCEAYYTCRQHALLHAALNLNLLAPFFSRWRNPL